MSDYDFFEGISSEAPIQEFADYYSIPHEEVTLLPKPIQDFGITLIALMESKPIHDAKSVTYLKNFLEAFCHESTNYKNLTQEGKEAIDKMMNSDNEFIMDSVSKVKC
jgi:hypothetical protein